ncbi:hypothetical protein [Thermomonospora cellulosilytica]|uniref:Uncharacterized protein n=1 Tax=Thermomonospora cellulosilytica TaxID=1411118 RepID=A0A7W3MVK7_9ACTN|nr:hypothetical protein [Thermomonospora cellulosilytica]MBA9002695.1 hypothetical protein [Thermomonospora cellulosilytica]
MAKMSWVVLEDPAFGVPQCPPGRSGVAWLRGSVARFSEGAVHARRRACPGRDLAHRLAAAAVRR